MRVVPVRRSAQLGPLRRLRCQTPSVGSIASDRCVRRSHTPTPSWFTKKENAVEREKALDMALAGIEKQFGKGSVMKMGEKTTLGIDTVPTGALALDLALGVGGLPRGRVIEI